MSPGTSPGLPFSEIQEGPIVDRRRDHGPSGRVPDGLAVQGRSVGAIHEDAELADIVGSELLTEIETRTIVEDVGQGACQPIRQPLLAVVVVHREGAAGRQVVRAA